MSRRGPNDFVYYNNNNNIKIKSLDDQKVDLNVISLFLYVKLNENVLVDSVKAVI